LLIKNYGKRLLHDVWVKGHSEAVVTVQ